MIPRIVLVRFAIDRETGIRERHAFEDYQPPWKRIYQFSTGYKRRSGGRWITPRVKLIKVPNGVINRAIAKLEFPAAHQI